MQRVGVRKKDHGGYIGELAAPFRFRLHGCLGLGLLSPEALARRVPTRRVLLP